MHLLLLEVRLLPEVGLDTELKVHYNAYTYRTCVIALNIYTNCVQLQTSGILQIYSCCNGYYLEQVYD